MKKRVWIFLAVILLTSAYAEDLTDPIFDEKTRTQIPFQAKGENFTFSYEPSQDKVFVQTPASSLIAGFSGAS